jgi:hypothetical protein
VTRGIGSMKNVKDHIGNKTRDLPACSAVPQPTALPGTPIEGRHVKYFSVSSLSRLHTLA